MAKEYKKGEILELTYKESGSGREIKATGVVFRASNRNVILAHNFSGPSPIDMTAILLRSILREKMVVPKEINFLSELSASAS